MNFFKSCLNLTLISLLTCTGLATPVLATPDFDNSVRDADDEGNLNSPGARTIKGDVTATDDLQDFRQFTLTGRANLRITGNSAGRTDLLLLRGSGQVIAKSSGSFSHSFTRNNLEAGKYIILVRSAQFNANSVTYQVNLDARS
ncbi:hypothetical protein [Chamaesiphon sp. OTE_8_metabat_110]|uniref:hypothetical protein n=1 Tax=Chamaesiphon sp. OTE_8_metabat_110 TaxID=2964696 RepID=UPI00286CD8CD|nr:hypothetical protein [Chamaesiphon sp. OTE_8_metabat_110]